MGHNVIGDVADHLEGSTEEELGEPWQHEAH